MYRRQRRQNQAKFAMKDRTRTGPTTPTTEWIQKILQGLGSARAEGG